jgi:dihydrofolate synthase/folylpolyglutamate synthase
VAIADAMLDALALAGIARTDAAARRSGYASVVWPGRLELLTINGRDVLLDGAHNPAGAGALAVALDDLRPFLAEGPVTLVTASMADKDVDGVIRALATSRALTGATVVCTSVDAPRAMPAGELAARWSAGLPGGRIVAEPDLLAAVDGAVSRSDRGAGPIVVAGSLYLVGAARARLVDDPSLRDPDPSEDA